MTTLGRLRRVAGSLPGAALVLWSATARAQAIDTTLWVTNGVVNSVVRSGNTLFVGGSFSRVGPATGGGIPFDGSGFPPAPFPKVVGDVLAATDDGSGGWYIGGRFTSVGGLPRSNLAHVASDFSVTAWDPLANGSVSALVLHGGTVYAGGGFDMVDGLSRGRIAAIDATTGAVGGWNPNANDYVYALEVNASGVVYAGGKFTNIGGQARNNLAALDGTFATATSWNPSPNGQVNVLDLSGSTVYAGGEFTTIGGQTRLYIAEINESDGLATSWDPGASSYLYTLAVSGTKIYAGGLFTSIGGASRNRVAAVDRGSGLATSWNPNANGAVTVLKVSVGGDVYVGGYFDVIGGNTRRHAAALDATTAAVTGWNPDVNGNVFAIAPSGSNIYVGGVLTSFGGVVRNNVAALDLTTGAATAWNPNANGGVNALVVSGATVYVGGGFTVIGGEFRNRLAALDGSGAATAWNPNADQIVYAMASGGGTVYVGGQFSNVGGQTRNNVAALDAATGIATPWDPNADARVFALALSGSTVYAGGYFATIGGQFRNYIAALDGASGAAMAWNPASNGQVNALGVNGATVYAGGHFTAIGGQSRNYIAALDAGSGAATAWNPNASDRVYALSIGGGRVYAGGEFTSIGGQARNRAAALDPVSGLVMPWNPDANNTVYALAVNETNVFAGGSFTSMAMLSQSGLARINPSPWIASVTPASGGNAGPVTITVHGTGIVPGGTLKLSNLAAQEISGTILSTAADGTSQTATFDLAGASTTFPWNVVATMPDAQVATLSNGFTIEAVQGPQLRVALVGSSTVGGNPAVRRDRRTAFDLVIENPGNVDAVSVPLWLVGVPLDATVEPDFVVSYPPQSEGEPDWSATPLFFSSSGAKYFALLIPRVPPGTTTRRFYITVPGPTHDPFQLKAALGQPWVDGQALRSCLTGIGVLTNAACMGAQLDAINVHLASNPPIQTLSGMAFWAKEAWQCEGATTLGQAVGKAGLVLGTMSVAIDGPNPWPACEGALEPWWRDVQTVTVVTSIDPNDKLGLQGPLSGQVVLPYSIRFENFSSASAPAQDVIVTDQLDASVLEMSTVSLDRITFGTRTIFPPPGLTSYATTVDLRPAKNLLVNVSASLDPVTHVLSWYFSSIDPATGRTPTDFMSGFLPPNVTPPEGEGSVLFTVMPKAGLSTGTQISNSASILFDDPPATNTPSWLNGVDNSPPSSNVLPLTAQSHQQSITVSWTAPGSPPDLRDFTIYVKQDAGPYRVWRLNTTATSDTLKPPPDHQLHTFSFYSVARDQIGNIEAPPPTPDATTQSTTAVGDAAMPLELAMAASPNPATGPIQVWLALPSRERATLELLDVAGRRVARREVGSLGRGSHLVTLPRAPAAGLYFLRLLQGDRALQSRVAVIR